MSVDVIKLHLPSNDGERERVCLIPVSFEETSPEGLRSAHVKISPAEMGELARIIVQMLAPQMTSVVRNAIGQRSM